MQHVEPPFDLEKTGDLIRVHGMAPEPRVYALVQRETGKLASHVIFHRFDDDSVFDWAGCSKGQCGEEGMLWR